MSVVRGWGTLRVRLLLVAHARARACAGGKASLRAYLEPATGPNRHDGRAGEGHSDHAVPARAREVDCRTIRTCARDQAPPRSPQRGVWGYAFRPSRLRACAREGPGRSRDRSGKVRWLMHCLRVAAGRHGEEV
jgi:hypothetical protein